MSAGLAAGSRNALDRVEGREIMDFMTRQEIQRSFGLWSSVAGYLRKKFEKAGGPRAADRLVS